MAFEEEKAAALKMVEGIELGTMSADESHALLDEADPVLVYFVFKWLRKRYRDHDLGQLVLGRMNEVRNTYRAITRKAKSAEDDPLVGWFEGSHVYADLSAEEFVDIVVEKLES
ncbi:MAG: hypothetical protein AAF721_25970 [Myxococcota bacterium]